MKERNQPEIISAFADCVCFLATETAISLAEIREMDLASFFVIIDYLIRKAEREKEEIRKARMKK